MIKDYFRMAFENFKQRKMRAWLTMIGIFIGITAVVAIISLGQGLGAAINEQFNNLGVDKIYVSPGSSAFGAASSVILNDNDRRIIEDTQGVIDTVGMSWKTTTVSFKDEETQTFVFGYTLKDGEELWNDMQKNNIAEGRLLKKSDTFKVFVGSDHAKDKKLWRRSVGLGDKLMINGSAFSVVGIQKDLGNSHDNGAVHVSGDAYKRIFGEDISDEYLFIIAQVEPSADPVVVGDRIERNLRNFRGVDPGDEDFTLQTSEEFMSTFNGILQIVNIVIIGIAAISLFIGGVGIMNTMYTAVVERTQEIGIMKAIGARNRDVLFLFLIESGLLGAIGGLIGVALGLGISKAVEIGAAAMIGTPYIKFWWSWELVLGAVLFGFVLGALSGLAPAYQASKKSPVESLQYE